jgi:hypothetical protein
MGFQNLTFNAKASGLNVTLTENLSISLPHIIYISLKPGDLELSNSMPVEGTEESKITNLRDI